MPEASAAVALKPRSLDFGFIGTTFDPWEFFGVLTAQTPALDKTTNLNAVLQKAYDAGVETIRFPIYWNKVETTAKGVYDWTDLDIFVKRATAYGFKLVPNVINAPTWARSSTYLSGASGTFTGNVVDSIQTFADVTSANTFLSKFQNASKMQVPSNNQDYADFMAVLATRYGSGSVSPVSKAGTTGASGSNVITLTATATNSGIAIGQAVTGTGIGTNAVVTDVGTLATSGSITNAVATSGTIRYTCSNTFTTGQVVTINGITGFTAANLTNAVISAVSNSSGTSAWFEVVNSATGTYSNSTGTAFTNSVTLSVANSGAVSGSINFDMKALFWTDSDHTKTITSSAASTSGTKIFSATDANSLPSNPIGWTISGAGITTASGTKINRAVSRTLSLNTATTGTLSTTANAYTLSAPRITNWQIWNEPNYGRLHEVRIQIGSGTAQTVNVKIGVNWPQHKTKIVNFGSTATGGKYPITLIANPDSDLGFWATSFIDLAYKSRTSIKAVDSNATVVLGAMASPSSREAITQSRQLNSAIDIDSDSTWVSLDAIYNASNAKNAFDVLAFNLYTDSGSYAGQFAGGAGNSTKIISAITNSTTNIIVKDWPPADTIDSSYAIIGGSKKTNLTEIVKITKVIQNANGTTTLTVLRGGFTTTTALSTTAKAFKASVLIYPYYPGIVSWISSKYTSGSVPKVILTEYGVNSGKPAGFAGYATTEAAQGTTNAKLLSLFVSNKTAWNLAGAYQFCLTTRDPNPPASGDSQWDFSGMIQIKSDGTLRDKPALKAFAQSAKSAEVR